MRAARKTMLSALLLAGLFAAPIATVALFVPTGRRARRAEERAKWLARLARALIWAAVLIAAVVGILALMGVTAGHIAAAAIGLTLACVVWLPVTRRWNARAHVCWATSTYVFVVYLAFMVWWTFASHLGITGDVGGMMLWLLELVAAGLGCAYLWELCDTLGRASWVRRIGTQELAAMPDGPYPFVCLQVPCYNEPPDMVIETLNSLRALDYPNYEIQVLDDNTDDETLWRPVEAWCKENGVKFVHLSDWPGYKSGALNYALEHMVEDSCELIGVIDSDYQIEPHFLRQCAPLFADEKVGFIQAPQDYRDWQDAPFYRRLYYSYHYFFAVSQPSRNERDGAIFAGTMGLIRRRALEQAGGWDEWCITEDAELSLRILRNGWSGLHVDQSFGKGIMPLTFEALKGQRFRWCFGGIQILRRHWRSMLPGAETKDNRLSLGQRWAYLCGGRPVVRRPARVVVLLLPARRLREHRVQRRTRVPQALGLSPRRDPAPGRDRSAPCGGASAPGHGSSWRDAVGAFLIWQSTTLTVTSASIQGLFAKEAVFLRTPKTHGDPRWTDAIKANWVECLFGLVGIVAIAGALSHTSPGGFLLAGLLVWPTVSFLAAPYNSLSAQRAALPPDLRERRRTEYLRYGDPTAHLRGRRTRPRRRDRGGRAGAVRARNGHRRTEAARSGEGPDGALRPGDDAELGERPRFDGRTRREQIQEVKERVEHDEHEHHVYDHDVNDIHDVNGANDVDGHLDDELDRDVNDPDRDFVHDRDDPDEHDHRVAHDVRADEHHVDDAVVTCSLDVALSSCSCCPSS